MKKKKEKIAPPETAAAAATTTDLKSLIHDHALFFDKLIELIPAKFYLPNDEDSKPWFKGLSKAAKASAKQQTKENIKKARRQRLDPEKSQSSTLDLLKQTLENKNSSDDDNEENEKSTNKSSIDDSDDDNEELETNRAATLSELGQRLQSRIKELKANRGNGKKSMRERRVKKDDQEKKRKRGTELGERSGGDGRDGKFGKSEGEFEKEVAEATKGIEFGKVKLGGEQEGGRKKKRKLSKAQELERAKRLEEAKKDPEKGEVVAKKHSWSAATSRAAGIKVHDDSKLLKQSMHKEKKKHEKNSQKWKDRVETREKMKGEKQQKRAGNIAERSHQKKMRKIAKREKKLMRPGFEGRKEGYINED